MAIENMKLMHECLPKHLRMEAARMIEDKETEEDLKNKRMKMERSTMVPKASNSGPPSRQLVVAPGRSG